VPTVRALGVAAYVGVPLVAGGQAVGAFCVIDTRPRAWTAEDVEVLTELAASAQREIDLRAAAAAAEAAAARLRAQQEALEASNRRLHDQAAELEAQAEALRAAGEELAARTRGRRGREPREGEFLAVMSHELRTPLNAIGGYAELMAMGLHGPVTDAQRGALARVQGAQRRLLALINDVLNYAKLESGRVEYALGVVDVRDVIADVAPLLEPQLAAKGLSLDVRLPDGPCAVWTDREKLGQVLVNLLSNATKFTDARHPTTGTPGRVTVAGRHARPGPRATRVPSRERHGRGSRATSRTPSSSRSSRCARAPAARTRRRPRARGWGWRSAGTSRAAWAATCACGAARARARPSRWRCGARRRPTARRAPAAWARPPDARGTPGGGGAPLGRGPAGRPPRRRRGRRRGRRVRRGRGRRGGTSRWVVCGTAGGVSHWSGPDPRKTSSEALRARSLECLRTRAARPVRRLVHAAPSIAQRTPVATARRAAA
jgi:hypothetical protein